MKKNLLFKVTLVVCILIMSTGIVAVGASLKTEIKAILNQEIKIKYNGIEQNMTDVNNNPVYPISYNGSTYLPIRAVSDMLGVEVEWDGKTQTIMLGNEEIKPVSLLSLEYKSSSSSNKAADKGSLTVTGDLGSDIVYKDGFSYTVWNGNRSADIRSAFVVTLDGKYNRVSFDAYVNAGEEHNDKKYTYYVYDMDTGNTIADIEVENGQIKKVEEIDVTGIKKIGFAAQSNVYFDSKPKAYFYNPIAEFVIED
ncbi:MAG: copper amine oxidase [Clostridiaceae bacterium]|nr:copper amine oxidase [Clostridiaceae bacterium]